MRPAERGIASAVDRSHAAFAELLDDVIVAERPPDRGRGSSKWFALDSTS